MIQITDKSQCCGCTACMTICPRQCITMQEDVKEGFLYPVVDLSLCIDCGACQKVCPVLHQGKDRKPLLVYAAKNMNEQVRLASSSGGIFTLLAERVIDEGGVVFGARFNTEWEVVHDYTETKDGLAAFRGSKYVQSCLGNSFQKVRSFLRQGRKVLFSGTPCQIAGLKNYLLRPYQNLLTVDVVCHGVPSPKAWRKYLNESVRTAYNIKRRNLSLLWTDKITDVNFRSKEKGWKKYHVKIEYRNGKKDVTPFYDNIYMKMFLSNLSLRPSCYACPSKLHHVQSDITLADFWGVDRIHPEIDDDKGCGLILVHNDYALALLKS